MDNSVREVQEGNLELESVFCCSIMMTACSSVLAFGGMPFNLWAYGRYWMEEDDTFFVIPFANIMRSLALISGPVIVGMAVRHYHQWAAQIITKVSLAAVVYKVRSKGSSSSPNLTCVQVKHCYLLLYNKDLH